MLEGGAAVVDKALWSDAADIYGQFVRMIDPTLNSGEGKMDRENEDNSTCEIEITPEMIEAGEREILGSGVEGSGLFVAADLAIAVYRAMAAVDLSTKLHLDTAQKTA